MTADDLQVSRSLAVIDRRYSFMLRFPRYETRRYRSSSVISWSFSLIFSGLLAREVTHRVRGSDYRAIGAAAYLGVGSVFALGLSSSAALIMAAPASLPQSILRISGLIPLSQTIGLW